MQLTDLNIGVLFILAVSSMGVYGIALAGWASNNKYSLLGGLRSSAQMISYELPLSLAIAAPLLLSNTLSLRELVRRNQAGSILHWNILHGPFPQIFSFIIFLIAASPKPTACRSICRKPKTNWWPAFTPNTAA